MQENDNKRKQKLIFFIACAVLAAVAVLAGAYLLWEEAPSVSTPEPTARPMVRAVAASPAPTEEPVPTAAPMTTREDGVYTFLLAGVDVGGGNTDTLMVGRLDTNAHTVDVVSIPRDTLINVEWGIRKVNSVYAGAGMGDEGIAALKEHIRKLIGFDVDCYAFVDLMLVTQIVDAMGGVDYDVPMDMDYDIGPVIHLKAGQQHLSGEEVLGLLRFRSGYIMGDLGRLDAQHDFLKAMAEQFTRLGSIPNFPKVIKLLSTGLITDLRPENEAFFIRQALQCPPENFNFYTMPNTPVTLNEYSYVTVEIRDWLDMINLALNPYEEAVGWGNVDIVYRDWDGTYHGTCGLRGAWYYPTAEEIAAAKKAAEEAAKATPTPEPSPGTEGEATPAPGEDTEPTPEPEPTAEPTPAPEPPAEPTPVPMEETLPEWMQQ